MHDSVPQFLFPLYQRFVLGERFNPTLHSLQLDNVSLERFRAILGYIDIPGSDLDAIGSENEHTREEFQTERDNLFRLLQKYLVINPVTQQLEELPALNRIALITEFREVRRQQLDRPLQVIHAQGSNLGLAEKFVNGQLHGQEWLTDKDIERLVKILGLKDKIHTTVLRAEEIADILHFIREAHKGDDPKVPYKVPLLLNKGQRGDFRDQGSHWIYAMIEIDPREEPPKITINCQDSLRISDEERTRVTGIFTEAIRYNARKPAAREIAEDLRRRQVGVVEQEGEQYFIRYQAFPTATIQTTVVGEGSQTDGWSCGYRALQGLLKAFNFTVEELAAKTPVEREACQQLIAAEADSADLRDCIYRLALGGMEFRQEALPDGVTATEAFGTVPEAEGLGKFSSQFLDALIEHVGKVSPGPRSKIPRFSYQAILMERALSQEIKNQAAWVTNFFVSREPALGEIRLINPEEMSALDGNSLKIDIVRPWLDQVQGNTLTIDLQEFFVLEEEGLDLARIANIQKARIKLLEKELTAKKIGHLIIKNIQLLTEGDNFLAGFAKNSQLVKVTLEDSEVLEGTVLERVNKLKTGLALLTARNKLFARTGMQITEEKKPWHQFWLRRFTDSQMFADRAASLKMLFVYPHTDDALQYCLPIMVLGEEYFNSLLEFLDEYGDFFKDNGFPFENFCCDQSAAHLDNFFENGIKALIRHLQEQKSFPFSHLELTLNRDINEGEFALLIQLMPLLANYPNISLVRLVIGDEGRLSAEQYKQLEAVYDSHDNLYASFEATAARSYSDARSIDFADPIIQAKFSLVNKIEARKRVKRIAERAYEPREQQPDKPAIASAISYRLKKGSQLRACKIAGYDASKHLGVEVAFELEHTRELQQQAQQAIEVEVEAETTSEAEIDADTAAGDAAGLVDYEQFCGLDKSRAGRFNALLAAIPSQAILSESELYSAVISADMQSVPLLWLRMTGGSETSPTRLLPHSIRYLSQEAVVVMMALPQYFLSGFNIDNLPAGFYLKEHADISDSTKNGLVLCYDISRYQENKGNPLRLNLLPIKKRSNWAGDLRQFNKAMLATIPKATVPRDNIALPEMLTNREPTFWSIISQIYSKKLIIRLTSEEKRDRDRQQQSALAGQKKQEAISALPGKLLAAIRAAQSPLAEQLFGFLSEVDLFDCAQIIFAKDQNSEFKAVYEFFNNFFIAELDSGDSKISKEIWYDLLFTFLNLKDEKFNTLTPIRVKKFVDGLVGKARGDEFFEKYHSFFFASDTEGWEVIGGPPAAKNFTAGKEFYIFLEILYKEGVGGLSDLLDALNYLYDHDDTPKKALYASVKNLFVTQNYHLAVSLTSKSSLEAIRGLIEFGPKQKQWWMELTQNQIQQVGYGDIGKIYKAIKYFFDQLHPGTELPDHCPFIKLSVTQPTQVDTDDFAEEALEMPQPIVVAEYAPTTTPNVQVFLDRTLLILKKVKPQLYQEQLHCLSELDFGTEGAWYAARWERFRFFHPVMQLTPSSLFDDKYQTFKCVGLQNESVTYRVELEDLARLATIDEAKLREANFGLAEALTALHRYFGGCKATIADSYNAYLVLTRQVEEFKYETTAAQAVEEHEVSLLLKLRLLPILAVVTTGRGAKDFKATDFFGYVSTQLAAGKEEQILAVLTVIGRNLANLKDKPTLAEMTEIIKFLLSYEETVVYGDEPTEAVRITELNKVWEDFSAANLSTFRAWDAIIAWQKHDNHLPVADFIQFVKQVVQTKELEDQADRIIKILALVKAPGSIDDFNRLKARLLALQTTEQFIAIMEVLTSLNLDEGTDKSKLPTTLELIAALEDIENIPLRTLLRELKRRLPVYQGVNVELKDSTPQITLDARLQRAVEDINAMTFDLGPEVQWEVAKLQGDSEAVASYVQSKFDRVKVAVERKIRDMPAGGMIFSTLGDSILNVVMLRVVDWLDTTFQDELIEIFDSILKLENKSTDLLAVKDEYEAAKRDFIQVIINPFDIFPDSSPLTLLRIPGMLREREQRFKRARENLKQKRMGNFLTPLFEKFPIPQISGDLARLGAESVSLLQYTQQSVGLFRVLKNCYENWRNLDLTILKDSPNIGARGNQLTVSHLQSIFEEVFQLAEKLELKDPPHQLLNAMFAGEVYDSSFTTDWLKDSFIRVIKLEKLSLTQKASFITAIRDPNKKDFVNSTLSLLENLSGETGVIGLYFDYFGESLDLDLLGNIYTQLNPLMKEQESLIRLLFQGITQSEKPLPEKAKEAFQRFLTIFNTIAQDKKAGFLTILCLSCCNKKLASTINHGETISDYDKVFAENEAAIIRKLKGWLTTRAGDFDILLAFFNTAREHHRPYPNLLKLQELLNTVNGAALVEKLTKFEFDPYNKRIKRRIPIRGTGQFKEIDPLDEQFNMDTARQRIDNILDLEFGRPLLYAQRAQLYREMLYINSIGRLEKLVVPGMPEATKTQIWQMNPPLESKAVKDLTNRQLTALIRYYRQIISGQLKVLPRQFELARLEFIALAREAMFRATGNFPRPIQIISLLNIMHQGGSSFSEIRTGEGKGIITALFAALKWMEGGAVDVCSANMTLAGRDLAEFSNFFEILGIPCALIRASSPTSAYQQEGVNYSDVSEMALFQEQRELYHDLMPSKVSCILDESDFAVLDNTVQFRFATALQPDADPIKNPFEDFYPIVLDFVSQKHQQGSSKQGRYILDTNGQNRAQDLESLIRFIEAEPRITNSLKVKLKKFIYGDNTKEIVDRWIDSAVVARDLKENEHFVIRTLSLEESQGLGYEVPMSFARVMINHRENPGSTFSDGVHQFLHARLNKEQDSSKTPLRFPIQPEKVYLLSRSAKGFCEYYLSAPGATVKPRGNIIGLTGTVGSVVERQEMRETYGLKFYRIPPHDELRREDRIILARRRTRTTGLFSRKEIFIESQEIAHFRTILENINQAVQKRQPILIICKSIADSVVLHQKLLKALPAVGGPTEASQATLQLYNGENRDASGQLVKEADVLANAGLAPWITITTPMLGRGTDIKLKDACAHPRTGNGLHVVCTDIAHWREYGQNIGRAARNGAKGSSALIVSEAEFARVPQDDESLSLAVEAKRLRLAEMQSRQRAERQGFADLKEQLSQQFIALAGQVKRGVIGNFIRLRLDYRLELEIMQQSLFQQWSDFLRAADEHWNGLVLELQRSLRDALTKVKRENPSLNEEAFLATKHHELLLAQLGKMKDFANDGWQKTYNEIKVVVTEFTSGKLKSRQEEFVAAKQAEYQRAEQARIKAEEAAFATRASKIPVVKRSSTDELPAETNRLAANIARGIREKQPRALFKVIIISDNQAEIDSLKDYLFGRAGVPGYLSEDEKPFVTLLGPGDELPTLSSRDLDRIHLIGMSTDFSNEQYREKFKTLSCYTAEGDEPKVYILPCDDEAALSKILDIMANYGEPIGLPLLAVSSEPFAIEFLAPPAIPIRLSSFAPIRVIAPVRIARGAVASEVELRGGKELDEESSIAATMTALVEPATGDPTEINKIKFLELNAIADAMRVVYTSLFGATPYQVEYREPVEPRKPHEKTIEHYREDYIKSLLSAALDLYLEKRLACETLSLCSIETLCPYYNQVMKVLIQYGTDEDRQLAAAVHQEKIQRINSLVDLKRQASQMNAMREVIYYWDDLKAFHKIKDNISQFEFKLLYPSGKQTPWQNLADLVATELAGYEMTGSRQGIVSSLRRTFDGISKSVKAEAEKIKELTQALDRASLEAVEEDCIYDGAHSRFRNSFKGNRFQTFLDRMRDQALKCLTAYGTKDRIDINYTAHLNYLCRLVSTLADRSNLVTIHNRAAAQEGTVLFALLAQLKTAKSLAAKEDFSERLRLLELTKKALLQHVTEIRRDGYPFRLFGKSNLEVFVDYTVDVCQRIDRVLESLKYSAQRITVLAPEARADKELMINIQQAMNALVEKGVKPQLLKTYNALLTIKEEEESLRDLLNQTLHIIEEQCLARYPAAKKFIFNQVEYDAKSGKLTAAANFLNADNKLCTYKVSVDYLKVASTLIACQSVAVKELGFDEAINHAYQLLLEQKDSQAYLFSQDILLVNLMVKNLAEDSPLIPAIHNMLSLIQHYWQLYNPGIKQFMFVTDHIIYDQITKELTVGITYLDADKREQFKLIKIASQETGLTLNSVNDGVFTNLGFRIELAMRRLLAAEVTNPLQTLGLHQENFAGLENLLVIEPIGSDLDPETYELICCTLAEVQRCYKTYEAKHPNELLFTKVHYDLITGRLNIGANYQSEEGQPASTLALAIEGVSLEDKTKFKVIEERVPAVSPEEALAAVPRGDHHVARAESTAMELGRDLEYLRRHGGMFRGELSRLVQPQGTFCIGKGFRADEHRPRLGPQVGGV